ncbi:hypothetical protein BGZ60DRAFT_420580 [Tricladium varicosporioides]|nr:hypothetical protein BGZ60DRAFT_420580 [Hymenoscyphus varicosporioides]
MLYLISSLLILAGARAHTCTSSLTPEYLIIGGGSAGTYTAIQLHDLNKDLLVIEASSILGGHANTYYDPLSPALQNVGVQGFHNTSITRQYIERLNVSLNPEPWGIYDTKNIDFVAGVEVQNFTAPPFTDVVTAFRKFRTIASQWADFDRGWQYAPSPIPSDLLLPFSDFTMKYGFPEVLQSIQTYLAPVELWKEPTIYVLKNFGLESIDAYLETISGHGYRPRDIFEVYTKAAAILGDKVLYNSTATTVTRSSKGVSVVASTPKGTTCIQAKKLIMAAPPLLYNLRGWELTPMETKLFGKLKGKSSQIAVFRSQNFDGKRYYGVGPNSTFGTPNLPGITDIIPTATTDKTWFSFTDSISPSTISQSQTLFKSQLKTLQGNGAFPKGEFEIVKWFDHKDYMCYVEVEEVKKGYYVELMALQGGKNTWFTGAVWAGQDSSLIWNFTKELLEKILKA